jgi:hypothetical protein
MAMTTIAYDSCSLSGILDVYSLIQRQLLGDSCAKGSKLSKKWSVQANEPHDAQLYVMQGGGQPSRLALNPASLSTQLRISLLKGHTHGGKREGRQQQTIVALLKADWIHRARHQPIGSLP